MLLTAKQFVNIVKYRTAVSIAQKVGDELLETTALNNRAYLLLASGDYAAALKAAQQSLHLARRLALITQEVSILDTLGSILTARGDYAQAEKYPNEGLALAAQTGSELTPIYYALSLGGLYLKQPDLEQAAAYFQQALARATTSGTLALQAQCHLRLSDVCERRGNLQQALRGVDAIGRYGGDEFCVALPETNAEQGRQAAERLQQGMAQHNFDTSAGSLTMTVSIGLSSLAGDAAAEDSLETLLDRADQALYRAKRAGRNRVWGDLPAGG